MRILVAIPLALVAALMLNALVWLVSGAGESSATPACLIGATGFGLCAFFWLRNTRSTRQTLRLALLTVAVESFGLAVAGLALPRAQAGGEPAAPLAGVQAAGLFGGVGLVLGVLCLVGYLSLRRETSGGGTKQG